MSEAEEPRRIKLMQACEQAVAPLAAAGMFGRWVQGFSRKRGGRDAPCRRAFFSVLGRSSDAPRTGVDSAHRV